MERLGRCSISIGLMVLIALTREAQASHDDLYEMHRVKKTREIMRHQRRDASCPAAGWSICPAAVGGGCCPGGYSCETESCVVATAGPTTACQHDNYYYCPYDKGAGCCPLGTICGDNDDACYLPEGIPAPVSCPASHHSCPASAGGGCCKSGMACGKGYCYETSPATFSVSLTVTTTNSNGDTITTTVTEATVITPGPGPGSSDLSATYNMVFPTRIPKLNAVEVDTSQGNGGLTQAQLGGIVAGVIAILITIVVAAFLVIRRLKKTAKIVAAVESKRGTSSGLQRSHKTSFGQTTVTEVDGFDVDPLTQTPSIKPSHLRSGSDGSFTDRSPSYTPNMPSNSSSPPTWSGPFNIAVPLSEAPSEGRRDHSVDSSQGPYDTFRYSQQTSPSHRISCDSHMTHSRNLSNASELSGDTVDGPGKLELENSNVEQEAGRRRASTSAAARSPPPTAHVRRSSGGAARGRSESAAAANPLGTVNEFGELHGFYGPPDQAVGQTAERLGRRDSTASSVASRNLKEAAVRLRRGDSSVSATPTEAYGRNTDPSE